ncbi:hypothetical protein ACFW08_20350 [Streptomyces sp. NPDC058960]|uniref:hypothetical protein n=1 Tax=Streptomyces sp. NPDC058960 TaxID=3346679 RepID=UPI0036A363B9
MICARCDKPIRDGEEYDKVINDGATAVGSDTFLHKQLCEKSPRQTYPARRWWDNPRG